jgi:hypothetical protein
MALPLLCQERMSYAPCCTSSDSTRRRKYSILLGSMIDQGTDAEANVRPKHYVIASVCHNSLMRPIELERLPRRFRVGTRKSHRYVILSLLCQPRLPSKGILEL